MWKKIGAILLSMVLTLSCTGAAVTEAYAATYAGEHFSTGFDSNEPNAFNMATWSNGGMFNCTFSTGNVAFNNGIMDLKIDRGSNGYTGGEYRTNDCFGYGMYSVNMKPIKNPGVVSSFFTYTGPADGTVWDEIDIEFLGKDTTKVQFNYYTNGVGGHEYLYNLGFDASKEYHTYSFYWNADSITWYVDWNPVYTATANIPKTPGHIMMNVWPGIGVDSWLQPYNGVTPLHAYYDWMSYDAPEGNSNSSNNNSNNNNKNNNNAVSFDSGRVYTIISKNSGKSIDVSWGNAANGTNILQYSYCGNANQKWYIQKQSNGYYIIKSYATGKVLDVQDVSMNNGANVHQWEYVGGANQMWYIDAL